MNQMQQSRYRWWDEKNEDDRAECLTEAGVHLWRNHEQYRTALRHYARLYGDLPGVGISPFTYGNVSPVVFDGPSLSLNVVRSIVDTFVSTVVQVPIRPTLLTSDGNWDHHVRAEGFQKFVDGAFYVSKFRELEPLLLRDAAIFGSYTVKWLAEKSRTGKWIPRAERVMPDELLFDRTDAYFGNPRMAVQRKLMDRSCLAAVFPEHKKKIEDFDNARRDDHYDGDTSGLADFIEVWESWHLPSSQDSDDGAHCVAVEDFELTRKDDRSYDDAWFPFTRFHYEEPIVGVWGSGIPQHLTGHQYEINRLLIDIQESQHMMAVPRLALPNGSQIVGSELTDEIGSIVRTSGDAPSPMIWPAFSQDVYGHLWKLVEQAYAIEGFSSYDAQAVKPAGLNSGAAQRAFADITSKRHTERIKRREWANLDAAKKLISLMRRIANVEPDFAMTFKGDKTIEQINWKKVNLDDEAYEIKCYSASALPLEPAARIQTVQEMSAAGWLTRAEGKMALGFPDFDALNSLDVAPYKLTLKLLSGMAYHGEYSPPDGILDLDMALKLSGKFYMLIQEQGAPESRLGLVRRFMADVEALMNKSAPTPPPGLQAPPGAPPELPPMPMNGAPPMPPPSP